MFKRISYIIMLSLFAVIYLPLIIIAFVYDGYKDKFND